MPTPPTGTAPHPRNATTRERDVIAELYRAGEHTDDPREAGAIRAGVSLLVKPIETRHRRQSNGFFDATAWFGDPASPGGVATLRACHALVRPAFIVEAGRTRPSDLADWIVRGFVRVLNVAGNRESTDPGIGSRVERFMVATFRRLD